MVTKPLQQRSFFALSWSAILVAILLMLVQSDSGQFNIVILTGLLMVGLVLNLAYFLRSRNLSLHALAGLVLFLMYFLIAAPTLGNQLYFWIFVFSWMILFLLQLERSILIILLLALCLISFIPYPFYMNILFSFLLVSLTLLLYEGFKSHHNNEMERLSKVDALTGTWNRRKLYELLNVELLRAKRYRRPVAAIMFDIDHFKSINDNYGHQFGDTILQKITEIVKNNLRSTDYLIRWGGEEFIILAEETQLQKNNTTEGDARALAERLKAYIEQSIFPKVKHITISLGVTELKPDDTIDTFLQRADDAVYKAKLHGRNRVEVIR